MWTKRVRPIIYVLLIVGLCGFPVSAQAFDVLLGSGVPGSFSYFTGRVLCRIINQKVDDVSCRQIPANDEVDNLTNLQGGSLDISLVDSRMLFDAVNKTGSFQFLDISYENLRAIAPLYDVPISLIVRNDANINSLADLQGKRINAGNPGSLEDVAVETIMKTKKWTRDDFSLVGALPPIKSQDAKAFCYGTMQAMVYVGVHPDYSLRHMLKTCNGSLLSMDDSDVVRVINDNPAFWKTTIASGTYPSHPQKVVTFGTRTMLVTSTGLDNETVSKIVAAIDNNQDVLATAHSALSLFSIDTAKFGTTGIKLHPGAAKYFADH